MRRIWRWLRAPAQGVTNGTMVFNTAAVGTASGLLTWRVVELLAG